jgi:hypothetical protein
VSWHRSAQEWSKQDLADWRALAMSLKVLALVCAHAVYKAREYRCTQEDRIVKRNKTRSNK